MNFTPRMRVLLGSAAFTVLSAIVPVTAIAQDTGPSAQPPQEEPVEVDEIVSVGTNIAGVRPVGGDVIAVSREDIEKSGLSNPADVVRRLPQVVTAASSEVGFQGGTPHQGYNQGQVETINLRGAGAQATLILIDGRRPVSVGAVGTATDANQLPIAAIERIEVLTDGASAIYGSDAVAGVVNYVVRKDYEGLEVSARYGNHSGGDEWGASLAGGLTWDGLSGLGRGNVIVAYEHQDREAYLAGQNRLLRNDLTPLGGADRRVNGGTASVGFSPNIVADTSLAPGLLPGQLQNTTIPRAQGFIYYGVPAGPGTGLTFSNLLLNQPSLVDYADYTDFIGAQVRDQLSIYANQSVTETVELFANVTYTNRETTSRSPGAVPAVTQSATLFTPRTATGGHVAAGPNPNFLALPPFISFNPPIPLNNQKIQYSFLKDGPENSVRTFIASDETINAAIGLNADLPGEWRGEGFYSYGKSLLCASCAINNLNVAALQEQVDIGAINPLSSAPLTEAQRALVYGRTEYVGRTVQDNLVVKANGPLFNLPAGPLRAAVGAEYRREENGNRNRSNTGFDNALRTLSTFEGTAIDREITSLTAEVYLPLIGEDMDVPLVKSLRASAAIRHDDYSDVGGTTNPRLGLSWEVNDNLRFSGTWGESFRAPNLTDINPAAITSGTNFGRLPVHPQSGILGPLADVSIILGANPNLVPETAESWSVGGAFSKGGLDVQASYYSIEYENRITFPGVIPGFLSALAEPAGAPPTYNGFGSLVIPISNPATCNNADINTADPKLQSILRNINSDFISGGGSFAATPSILTDFCKIDVVLDSTVQNLASVKQTGLDLSLGYFAEVGEVDVTARVGGTFIFDNLVRTRPIDPEVENLGQFGQPLRFQGTASLNADWRGYSATLFARHYGTYLNKNLVAGPLQTPQPAKKLGGETFFDLTLAYRHQLDEPYMRVKGYRAQLAITNVFDKDFPVELTNGVDTFPTYNRMYGYPFGRTYSVQLTATF